MMVNQLIKSMDAEHELIEGFDDLKISAFTKYSTLNKDDIRDVTIGPNRTITDEDICSESLFHSKERLIENKENTEPSVSNKVLVNTAGNPSETNCATRCDIIQENGLPIREIIKDFESERQNNVQNAMRIHLDKFERHSEQLENERKQKWLNQQEKLIQRIYLEEQKILRALKEDDFNQLQERQKLTAHYQNLAEQRKRNAAVLAAKEKERKEMNLYIDNIKKIHTEFVSTYIEVLNFIKSCQENDDFKALVTEDCKQLKLLFINMEEIVTKCKTCKVDVSYVKKAQDILSKIKSLREEIFAIATKLKNKEQELQTAEAPSEPEKPKVSNATENNTPASNDPPSQPANMDANVKDTKQVSLKLDKYVSKDNLSTYTEILAFMQKYIESFKDLSENKSLKQFKSDCKKAVNIPVNAIPADSPQHLQDKYERLSNLLLGKVVRIGEDTQFTPSRHPQGVAFCIDLLAEKMVLQGELMISSKQAFPYATIIVSLWNTVPDFGKLLLAYFYRACPYLVPFNIPKYEGQSDAECYSSQGYRYNDGQIEKQDKYLKRMTGIMYLYSAIIISKPKRDQNTHPHGIEQGWRWLASILKLEPRLDITATLIHTFLKTAGYNMQAAYGKGFQKLLKIIAIQFLPVMKQMDSGGHITKLEVLLQEYQERGQFEKPEGILPDNFW